MNLLYAPPPYPLNFGIFLTNTTNLQLVRKTFSICHMKYEIREREYSFLIKEIHPIPIDE